MGILDGVPDCPECKGTGKKTERWFKSSASPAGSKTTLEKAIDCIDEHDKLTLMEKLADCQNPKWERLLRQLVAELTDRTVRF